MRRSTARRRPMRSAGPAVLLPALWWVLAQVGDLPIALSELGASAGLNLMLDRFAIETPDGWPGPRTAP
jgi:hypothetical protein